MRDVSNSKAIVFVLRLYFLTTCMYFIDMIDCAPGTPVFIALTHGEQFEDVLAVDESCARLIIAQVSEAFIRNAEVNPLNTVSHPYCGRTNFRGLQKDGIMIDMF